MRVTIFDNFFAIKNTKSIIKELFRDLKQSEEMLKKPVMAWSCV